MTNPTNAALLVPLRAEALVMNSYVRTQWTQVMWRRFVPNWQGFASSMSPPFSDNLDFSSVTAADDGVYVHWALPTSLRRTVAPKQGEANTTVNFPDAPNRWLVMRVGPLANGTRQLRAWVIQSDYLTGTSGSSRPGTSNFVHPFTSSAGALQAGALGTHIDIQSYTGDLPSDSDGQPAFLYACGPGDVSFAAYQPGVNDVFAFFDQEITTEAAGSYDYLVAGWHAGASADPLAGTADFTSLIAAQNWTVLAGPDAPGQTTPSSASFTVYHSAQTNVQWVGILNPTGPSAAVGNPQALSVYVGSTALDALCTAIRHQAGGAIGAEYALRLQALMMGMLPQAATPAGAVRVQEAVERSRFASTPGATQFAAVAYTGGTGAATTGAVTLTAAQQSALDALNTAQLQHDTLTRQLASQQWDLYQLWWKSQQQNQWQAPSYLPEQLDSDQWDAITSYINTQLSGGPGTLLTDVAKLQATIATLASGLPASGASPADLYAFAQQKLMLPATVTIKAVPQPRFYQPLDPAVLVSGLPKGLKYANDDADANGNLPCRFSTQIIGGVQAAQAAIVPASVPTLLQVPANAHLPANVMPVLQALCQEMFFLNPSNATPIAQVVPGVNAGALQQQMQAQQGMLGTPPIAAGVQQWTQPFSPLYLEWQVQYIPTPLQQMNGWTFNADDYAFNGAVTGAFHQTYSGRGVISAHAADTFRQRVVDYLTKAGDGADPDIIAVLAILNDLDSPDMLCQSLSGLHAKMLMHDPGPTYPPPPPIATEVGDAFHAAPFTALVANADLRPPSGGTQPYRWFFPVRAGWFRFTDLRIIDVHGQTIDLLSANNNPIPTGQTGEADYFAPLPSPELAIDPGTTFAPTLTAANWLRMPPRVVQTSRLDLSLPDAAPGNPVHGWLVPNHLDQGISVYDAAGTPLGEVMAVLDARTGASTTAIWVPAPTLQGAPPPPLMPSQISDAVLSRLVSWLVTNSSDGRLMQAFMDCIDETLWTINPLGGRADPNMNVLMGQPLAVVQLTMQYELEGTAANDQSFTETSRIAAGLTPNTIDLLTQRFTLQVGDLQRGDDGVIGYFTSVFDAFNSVVDPTTIDPQGGSSFVHPIGQNNNWLSLTYAPGASITVTALVDPRGSIHVRTGAQPVVSIDVPGEAVTAAMSTLAITFRTGPMLTDPSVIRIPRPAEKNGQWLWLGYAPAGGASGPLLPAPIVAANSTAQLGNAQVANEGWLQFTPSSPTGAK